MKKLLLLIGIFMWSVSAFAQDSSVQGRIENFQGLIGVYNDLVSGKKTASGEIYDPNALTAAHKDLPFGTQLRVTNFANGRSVVVKVNDRGTKNKGRVLEVSKKAAQTLDFLREGVAYVKVDVLSDTLPIESNEEEPALDARMDDEQMSVKIAKTQKPQDTDDGFYQEPVQDKNNLEQPQENFSKPIPEEEPKDVELNTKAVNQFKPESVTVDPATKKMSVNRIFVIQFGAFSTQEKAELFQKQLATSGFRTYYAKEGRGKDALYKVREVTIYRDLQEVFSKVLDYKKQGFDCFVVGKFFVDDKKI